MTTSKGEKVVIEENVVVTDTVAYKSPSKKKKYIRYVLVVIFIASIIHNIYAFNKIRVLTQNPAEVSQKEIQDIVAKVSKLMVLPNDETPTLATVSDPEKLKGQAFFANAKLGDKVLVYSKAQKAILYNPSENKIIEVAPIGSNPTSATTIPTPTPTTETTKKK